MPSHEWCWRVEETCLRAWPALREAAVGDWLLRFAGGVSRRANSANPRHARAGDVAAILPAAEAQFRKESLPVLFRIPSLIPRVADRTLERLGYSVEGETATLYGDLAEIHRVADAGSTLLSAPGRAWGDAMVRLQGFTGEKADSYRRVVESIDLPAAFAALHADGEPAALAYGVVHDGLLCFESVITGATHSGRGYARRVLGALAHWAASRGAHGACLQVQADNAAAVSVYRRLGLKTELYRYHYRRAPVRPA